MRAFFAGDIEESPGTQLDNDGDPPEVMSALNTKMDIYIFK